MWGKKGNKFYGLNLRGTQIKSNFPMRTPTYGEDSHDQCMHPTLTEANLSNPYPITSQLTITQSRPSTIHHAAWLGVGRRKSGGDDGGWELAAGNPVGTVVVGSWWLGVGGWKSGWDGGNVRR